MSQRIFQSLAQAAEAYYDELRAYVVKRTGSSLLADDVVQETWVRARSTSAPMPDNPRAYLYRMANNVAIDHLRRDRRRPEKRLAAPLITTNEGIDRVAEVPSPAPSPEEVTGAREEFAILQQAVNELPERCREVFLLYRGQGLSMKQVAAHLSISEKTVEKHIARAMVHCRKRLQEAGRDL